MATHPDSGGHAQIRREIEYEKVNMPAVDGSQITKPHGTLICPHCGSIQCGLLDLKCDECEVPVFSLDILENALKYYCGDKGV